MNGLFLLKRRLESQISYMTAVAALTSLQHEYVTELVQQAGAFIGNVMKLDKIVPRSNENATFFCSCLLSYVVSRTNTSCADIRCAALSVHIQDTIAENQLSCLRSVVFAS